ncbi:MAG: hypothetical protein HUJ26_02745 [Planctomycetaceae bacterium]|nr:hypothetical protein [Planctomycetaceae bacterium]
MKRAFVLGLSVAAIALFANVNSASADHCRSGYSRGYSGYRYSSPYRSGYRNYRYSTPYYNSFNRRRGGFRGYGHNHYHRRGRSGGLYIQGRNFGFGLRY